ncbi:MAG: hypothetical protein H0V53_05610 [Rubrobacter sp.]|nr:hypothetical protein [Rubrobacter sp.]
MREPEGKDSRPWWVTIAAVVGLLLAIIVAGVAGLILNRSVAEVTDDALRYDTRLEDYADDLRISVLELRDAHRTLLVSRPGEEPVEEFERAHDALLGEVSELEEIGVREQSAPQPEYFRSEAERYYEEFRPALELYDRDPAAFGRASDRRLALLTEIDDEADELYEFGDELATESLQQIDWANETAQVVLAAIVGGLALAGGVLALAAVRVVGELRRLSEGLARASQAKTQFIADASHELRTPLTVLRGTAQLSRQVEDPEVRQKTLGQLSTETERMTRIVENLLLLARSDSDSLMLDLEAVDAETLVSGAVQRARALARESGATLESRTSVHGELRVDTARIEQSVLILVDNAAKHGAEDGRIELTSQVADGNLTVEVADSGPGIPEERLDRIFDRFHREDRARSRQQGGAGLGLPIARTIVEAHGGRIEAESAPGDGTKMKVHLPLLP